MTVAHRIVLKLSCSIQRHTKSVPKFNIGKLKNEDVQFEIALNKERYERSIEKSETMKIQIQEEEQRIIRAEANNQMITDDSLETRDLPCADHHYNNCDICYYGDEEMVQRGQKRNK